MVNHKGRTHKVNHKVVKNGQYRHSQSSRSKNDKVNRKSQIQIQEKNTNVK